MMTPRERIKQEKIYRTLHSIPNLEIAENINWVLTNLIIISTLLIFLAQRLHYLLKQVSRL